MHAFLARQPILDDKQNLLAYEIFYRSGFLNVYTGDDHNEATANVIIDIFQNLGLHSLTSNKPAFINFPTALLEQEVATLFPKDQLVVEVLESVQGHEEVLAHCRRLKDHGYVLALDDFVYSETRKPFLEVADIVKIDILALQGTELESTVQRAKEHGMVLLAEKIETYEHYEHALDLGFTLFQGYFFSRPEIVIARVLAPLDLVCLELIVEANQPEIDLEHITEIISRDLSLTYSLLRLANSAAFGRRNPTTTVKDALIFLGQREIKKWVSLLAMQRMCNTTLEAPVITSLVRGRFAELLAEHTPLREMKDTLFLCGLFSLLDVLLQRPLMDILEEIQAPPEMIELLVHGKGPYQKLWQLVLDYERGRWDQVEAKARELNIEPALVLDAYLRTLEWCPRGEKTRKIS